MDVLAQNDEAGALLGLIYLKTHRLPQHCSDSRGSANLSLAYAPRRARATRLSQLKGGDAEDPFEPHRRDRAGIHACSLENRREPEVLRQRDGIFVDAGNVEEDLAAADARQ